MKRPNQWVQARCFEMEKRRSTASWRVAYRDREVREYDLKVKSVLKEDASFDYLVEPKVEGTAVELTYAGGRLVKGAAIEDDSTGEDVTNNIKTILSVPLTLIPPKAGPGLPDRLAVRGEVYIEKEEFESLNRALAQQDLPPFQTPKDAASASLLKCDRKVAARRPLNIFCRGAGRLSGRDFETQYDLMIALQQWGFRINRPYLAICRTIEEAIDRCGFLRSIEKQCPYRLEGALITVNRFDLRDLLERAAVGSEEGMLLKFR